MTKIQHDKYASFCNHNFQKSLTNQIKVPCKDNHELSHVISQIGKICNRCTSYIMRSAQKQSLPCIICSDKLEQYLNARSLCPHDQQQDKSFNEVIVSCNKKNAKFHQVPLQSPVCRICHDKIRAVFNGNPECPVCQGRQKQVMQNLQKTLASPSLNYMRNLIKSLKNEGSSVIRKQIELYCLAPCKDQKGEIYFLQDQQKSILSEQFRKSYENNIQSHPSKRYLLYPKCREHRQMPLCLCNECLVAVLNLETCPYGCFQQAPIAKQKDNVKISEVGFLAFAPKKNTNNQQFHLQMLVIRHIQEKGRLDRWEGQLRKIRPNGIQTKKLMHCFPLYSGVAYVSQKKYLLTGGKQTLAGKASSLTLLIGLSQDNRQFSMKKCTQMNVARASHALVYDDARKLVYALGGFSNNQFMRECQGYSLNDQRWIQMASLNIQRSKPTGLMYKNLLYVFGGLSRNQQLGSCLAQQYSFSQNKWKPLVFEGYQYPFISGMTPSTVIPCFQEKQLLLFGGSNYSNMTQYIQNLEFYQSQENKAFKMNCSSQVKLQKLNFSRCNSVIGLMAPVIQSTKAKDAEKGNEKVIVVFGGLQQHQQSLSIDAVRVRQGQNFIQPIFTYDQSIQIGSYRLLIREDACAIYQQMKNSLIQANILNQKKLEKPQDDKNQQKMNEKNKQKGKKNAILSSQSNMRLIENLWYGAGRAVVSVYFGSQ